MEPQKMFSYGNNKYRFISDEPIKTGDKLVIKMHVENGKSLPVYGEVTEVIESRKDCGKWNIHVITNTVICL